MAPREENNPDPRRDYETEILGHIQEKCCLRTVPLPTIAISA
jgi:hypothetical protein